MQQGTRLRARQRWRLTALGCLAATAALIGAACGGDDGGQPGPQDPSASDRVSVQVWDSPDAEPLAYELICDDTPRVEGDHGGRVADPAQACSALSAAALRLVELTDGIPADEICTEIYGGPQEATIRGTVDGQEIDAAFSRSNGCRIADWDALAPVLGPGGV